MTGAFRQVMSNEAMLLISKAKRSIFFVIILHESPSARYNEAPLPYFCQIMRISLLLSTLFLASIASSQTKSIHIQLLENNKTPIVGATVKLLDRADTTNVQFAISDLAGQADFGAELETQYIVAATYTSMRPFQKGLVLREAEDTYRFYMQEDAQALKAVTIAAKKPLLRQEDDMTIVDPEPLVNSSTSAFDILEKTPGLFLDQDGNVYISSTTPATIHINGREQKMSAEDVAYMLKNLPPNSIERIEILRTPSAKYDASGSGGIVNVVLKKGVKIGRTGSVRAGINQGRYGNQFGGISINNSDGGRTSYLNLNYSHRNSYSQLNTNRQLSPDTLLMQDAYTVTPRENLYLGYGLGIELNPNWDIDLDGRASYGTRNSSTNTENTILKLSDDSVQNANLNTLFNDGHSLSINQGVASKLKLDTIGSELNADVSYNYRQNTNQQDFSLVSKIPANSNVLGGLGDIENNRQSLTAKVDLKYKWSYEIILETGVKSAFQRFENRTAYKTLENGMESPDPFRTNTFDFKEAIHAAYAQASKPFGQFLLKAGARLENTNMFGHQQVPADTSFSIQRSDLFPYIFLSRRLMKIFGYELRAYLVYRKSIRRPAYSYLNPFPRFLDQYLYESGNPGLRPQFTENYEANISFENRPVFAIGRNYTKDIFTNVIYQDPNLPGVANRTYDNLGKNEETYFKLMGALPPGGTYFFVAGAQYNLNKYNGLYENKPLTFTRGSWSFFTYHQLKLGSRSSLTMNGFFRMKGQSQFYELSNFGSMNMSINRRFFDRKLTIALYARDIFLTNRNEFSIDQGSITAYGTRRYDTRRLGLNVRYSFGLKKREEQEGNIFNTQGIENPPN